MSIIYNIAQAYRNPRGVLQMHLDRGIQEAQTLFYAMFFGVINFIANYPRIVQEAPSRDDLWGQMATLFISFLFFMPLALYGIAAIIHWVLRQFGGRAHWAEARHALIWSAVVCSPFVVISGGVYIFKINSLIHSFQVITGIVFLWQAWVNFTEIEFKQKG